MLKWMLSIFVMIGVLSDLTSLYKKSQKINTIKINKIIFHSCSPINNSMIEFQKLVSDKSCEQFERVNEIPNCSNGLAINESF